MTILQTIRKASDLVRSLEGPRRGELPALDRTLCWLCGYPFGHVRPSREIELAHIVSVEEAPELENDPQNLIPLCRSGSVQSVTDYLDTVDCNPVSSGWLRTELDVGCHDLYDEGLISRTEIRLARALECGCFSTTRRARSAESLSESLRREYGSTRGLPDYSRQTWRTWEEVEGGVRDLPDSEFRRILNTACESIKAERRRSLDAVADNARRRSEQVLNAVQPWIEDRPDTWSVYQRLLYESALALMAARLARVSHKEDVARAERVEDLLTESIDFAQRAAMPKQVWFSTAERFHAQVLHSGRLARRTSEQCETDLKALLGSPADGKDFDSLRWSINFLLHRAKWHVLRFEPKEAAKYIAEARRRRDEGKGWTAMQRIHINVVDGMVLALNDGADQALRPLVRAITAMGGGRAKRPEGIVDAMRCLADVLAAREDDRASLQASERIRRISDELDDGRSGVWTSRHRELVVKNA